MVLVNYQLTNGEPHVEEFADRFRAMDFAIDLIESEGDKVESLIVSDEIRTYYNHNSEIVKCALKSLDMDLVDYSRASNEVGEMVNFTIRHAIDTAKKYGLDAKALIKAEFECEFKDLEASGAFS